jgi:ADP-ribose pyrophosphatase YjhB (NUDIX family)
MQSKTVNTPRVGVGVIIERNGQVLLIKRTFTEREPGLHLVVIWSMGNRQKNARSVKLKKKQA